MQGSSKTKPDHGYDFQIPFLWYASAPGGRLLEEKFKKGVHQGNHVEMDEWLEIYYQSAIILDLSSWQKV
jgi:hypothetical protein